MAESQEMRTLREITRVVLTHGVSIALIVAILTGGTYLACMRARKSYASSVTFLARQPRLRNPTAQNVSADRSLSVFIKTQESLATSDTVVLRTLTLLGDAALRQRWEALRLRTGDPATDPAWAAFAAELDAVAAKHLEGATPQDAQFREDFRDFRRNLKVETPGGSDAVSMSEILEISVTRRGSPQDARLAADVVARAYIDRYREVGTGQSREASKFVEAQLTTFESAVLEPAEKAVNKFVSEDLASPADLVILEQLSRAGTEAGRQIVVRRFQEETITLDGQLATARQLQQQLLQQVPASLVPATAPAAGGRAVIPEASAVVKLSDEALKTVVLIVPEDTLKANDVIASLKKKEVELIVKRNRLEVEFQEGYRELVDVNQEIVKARREILRELIGEVRALDIKIATSTARQQEIQLKIDAETKRLDALSKQLVRYQQLQHALTVAREQYKTMRQEVLDAQSQQQQERGAITLEIVGPASLPDESKPAFPKTPLFTLVAAGVGLLLSVAYAFLADHFDHTLRWSDEAERHLGVPVVGSIGKHMGGLLS